MGAGRATIAAAKTVRVRKPPPPATAEPTQGDLGTPKPAPSTPTATPPAPDPAGPPAPASPRPAAGGSAGRYAQRFR